MAILKIQGAQFLRVMVTRFVHPTGLSCCTYLPTYIASDTSMPYMLGLNVVGDSRL